MIKNAQGAAPFDRGRRAGLNGRPKRPNPFDQPERQTGSTMAWERRCSEWDEGWSAGNAERQGQQKTETLVAEKKLLFCWVAQNLNVLVPKKRGDGFLKVPYGHHHNMALTDIANGAQVDVTGLDGALEFECGGDVFHGGEAVRKTFVAKVIPKLEGHYGFSAEEIDEAQFWAANPLTTVSTI